MNVTQSSNTHSHHFLYTIQALVVVETIVTKAAYQICIYECVVDHAEDYLFTYFRKQKCSILSIQIFKLRVWLQEMTERNGRIVYIILL